MEEIPVPKDIRTFQPKFIGPFTKRQTFAIIPAGIIAISVIGVFGSIVSKDILVFLIIIICAPILGCGFIDIYGMPLWVFAKDVLLKKLTHPAHRLYKTENVYEQFCVQNKITYAYFDDETGSRSRNHSRNSEREHKRRLNRFLKEHPELRPIN